MPAREAIGSARGHVVPPCFLCHSDIKVRQLVRPWQITASVKYWTCDNCAVSWTTRVGDSLPAIAADRSPGKFV
jgi:hypothetical protein